MIQCNEGHFYDPARHSSCPWCAKPFDLEPAADVKTTPLRPSLDDAGKTTPLNVAPPAAEDPKTTPLYVAKPLNVPPPTAAAPEARPVDPVVGWLVAVEGPERGKDFRLHAERNFVGRAADMDVSLALDARVSRFRHAIVTFEPRKKVFYLSPGDASGLVYLNGDLLDRTTQIGPDDQIEIGDSKLRLVPFVGDTFNW
jgi:hypothetical protein